MRERVPGEVDAFSTQHVSPAHILKRIADNVRARVASIGAAFATEEETNFLLKLAEEGVVNRAISHCATCACDEHFVDD